VTDTLPAVCAIFSCSRRELASDPGVLGSRLQGPTVPSNSNQCCDLCRTVLP
jgi:hypothetical protein